MDERFILHHIGCAVRDIEVAKQYYCNLLSYKEVITIVEDEKNIMCCFLKKDNHYIELIQSLCLSKKSIIDKIIQQFGGGTYHHCYKIDDLESAIETLEMNGFTKLTKRYQENNYIKYIYMITPDNYLIEFLESKKREKGIEWNR